MWQISLTKDPALYKVSDMNVQPNPDWEQEPSLIEDVVAPHAKQYTDVSREEVRRRSVGNLYRQYLRRQTQNRAPAPKVIESVISTPVSNSVAKASYSRVPPLQTFPSWPAGTATNNSTDFKHSRGGATGGIFYAAIRRFTKRAELVIGAFILGWTTIWKNLTSTIYHWLPKRYTAAAGLMIDWNAKLFSRLKILVPSALVVGLLVLAALTGPLTAPGNTKSKHKSSGNSSPAAAVLGGSSSSSSSPSSSRGGTTVSSTPTSGSSAVSQSGSGAASTAEAVSPATPTPTSSAAATTGSGIVGGRGAGPIPTGGGSTPLPAPTPSTPTLTLTVPPTEVSAGGKTLINTTGTSITGN